MDQIRQKTGQAITEYILLLAILITLFTSMIKALGDTNALNAIKKPLEKEFKYTYQYGHPKARGQDDGGPTAIPQHADPSNFRIFINPPISE